MSNVQKEYERIKKYAARSLDDRDLKYDLTVKDMIAMRDDGSDMFDVIFTAFNYGFEKGCRTTRKAAEQTT